MRTQSRWIEWLPVCETEGTTVPLPSPAPPVPSHTVLSSIFSAFQTTFLQLRTACSLFFTVQKLFSVCFSNCFVYAILVSIPKDCVYHSLQFCVISPSTKRRGKCVEGESWYRNGNSKGHSSLQLLVSPPCRTLPITPGRFIFKNNLEGNVQLALA